MLTHYTTFFFEKQKRWYILIIIEGEHIFLNFITKLGKIQVISHLSFILFYS